MFAGASWTCRDGEFRQKGEKAKDVITQFAKASDVIWALNPALLGMCV
jgi:hypothetical protein